MLRRSTFNLPPSPFNLKYVAEGILSFLLFRPPLLFFISSPPHPTILWNPSYPNPVHPCSLSLFIALLPPSFSPSSHLQQAGAPLLLLLDHSSPLFPSLSPSASSCLSSSPFPSLPPLSFTPLQLPEARRLGTPDNPAADNSEAPRTKTSPQKVSASSEEFARVSR